MDTDKHTSSESFEGMTIEEYMKMLEKHFETAPELSEDSMSFHTRLRGYKWVPLREDNNE